MTPAERQVAVTRVEQQPDGSFLVHLPFRDALAIDEEHARRLVYAEACGSVIRWEPLPSEGELRALWGNR